MLSLSLVSLPFFHRPVEVTSNRGTPSRRQGVLPISQTVLVSCLVLASLPSVALWLPWSSSVKEVLLGFYCVDLCVFYRSIDRSMLLVMLFVCVVVLFVVFLFSLSYVPAPLFHWFESHLLFGA